MYTVKPTESPTAFIIEGPGINLLSQVFHFASTFPQAEAEHTARQLTRAYEAGKDAGKAEVRKALGLPR